MSRELKELRDIKRLLILSLKSSDVEINDIADVLGVDQSAISHLLNPKKSKIKKRLRNA